MFERFDHAVEPFGLVLTTVDLFSGVVGEIVEVPLCFIFYQTITSDDFLASQFPITLKKSYISLVLEY